MTTPVLVERHGALATISLNRPESGNAINMALAEALLDAAIACDEDESVRTVILQSAGRAFCVGGDLRSISEAGTQVHAFLIDLTTALHKAVSRLVHMKKPLVTRVQGPVAGAGIGLAAIGDIVLAAQSSSFTPAYVGVGLTPDGGTSWFLPRLVGRRRAHELLLTNRRITADEAAAMGLVTRVVADDQLDAEIRQVAEQLAKGPLRALSATRALLLEAEGSSLETHLDRESRSIAAAAVTPEGVEGITSFLEKRSPEFL